MKNVIFSWRGLLLLAILSLVSCKQDDIMLYQQADGVYFNGYSTTYNFIENAKNLEWGADTVNVPILITGMAADHDRPILMEEAKGDTLFTAEPDMYEILGGTVPAGEYAGLVRVKINYTHALDDSIYVARFRIAPNNEFPVVDLNGGTFSLSITNKFTQPANWSRLKSSFGNYSNSWYTFILKVTGLSSIPYWSYNGSATASNPDPERWTMTYVQMKAYAAQVKVALTKYNNEHPGNPLKHEDGEFKGQAVTMP